MNKFALMALGATVNARRQHHGHHQEEPPMQPQGWVPQMPSLDFGMPNFDQFFKGDLFEAPQPAMPEQPKCQIDEADIMDDNEFMRKTMQGIYKSSMKGLYRSSTDIISDECLGDWMNDSFTGMYALIEKFQTDPFSIGIDEAKKVMDDLIDMKYKNIEECQFEKLSDNMMHWCLDNYDVCMGRDDQYWQRIMDNGMDIIAATYDFFTVLMKDDGCNTSQQNLDEMNTVALDMSKVTAELYGFNSDWNATYEHITEAEFEADLAKDAEEEAKAQKSSNPFKKSWSGSRATKFIK